MIDVEKSAIISRRWRTKKEIGPGVGSTISFDLLDEIYGAKMWATLRVVVLFS